MEAARLDAHLAQCSKCRSRQDAIWALRRSMGIAPAVEPSSLSVGAAPRGHEILRWALFVIGGTLVLVNLAHLVGWGVEIVDHSERHGSVFGAALGVAMLVVAARPHRAIGLVPLTSTAMALMLVVIGFDLAKGRASILDEGLHLVELAGLVCLWVISGGVTRLGDLVNPARR